MNLFCAEKTVLAHIHELHELGAVDESKIPAAVLSTVCFVCVQKKFLRYM